MPSLCPARAQLGGGDRCDSVDLPQRIDSAQGTLKSLRFKQKLKAVVADRNYHSSANVRQLQQAGLRVVIADGSAHKRQEYRLPEPERQALQSARETLQSESGRRLMRLRGQHIERSFAHILDCGGMRRATLRGQANLQKRYVFAAACYNLSQLLRKQFGCRTLKMALATAWMRFLNFWLTLTARLRQLRAILSSSSPSSLPAP